MLRKILLSAVVILLLSSGAFANIGQVQGFSIGEFNKVQIVGAFGSAVSRNTLEVGQRQTARNPRLGSAAIKQGGILTQHARVRGRGGTIGVVQNASVDGSQHPFISGRRRGPNTQGQSLNLNLNTTARKPVGGIGCVVGSQSFVGGQSQRQATRGGFSASSQFVQAEQGVKIMGGQRSNVVVKNNLNVTMFQGDTPP
ncbi:unnamed protein product [marine sediment metagenome]|uniref:Uncharacterized protein n=1 Tax=marine sediment metagenome TaxID=412755 RepID=X0XHY6_9ZZZZ